MKRLYLSMMSTFLVAAPAWADPTVDQLAGVQQQLQQLTATVQQLTATVQAQQQRLAVLEQTNLQLQQRANATPSTAAVAQLPSPNEGVLKSLGTGLSRVAQSINPEIGVVADVVGQLSESSLDAGGNDKLSVREVELVFGSAIDPYSRFDSTITFSDVENPDIEEAYITHWGLPGEIKAKLGRMRPRIGKASAVHGDQLDTVDEPLVVSEYLGKEGLFRTGLELSGFLPTPWTSVTHEVTAGMIEGGVGDGGTLFGSTRRFPSLYAHLKNFWDISDMSNLEIGTTYLTGAQGSATPFDVHAIGLDATLVHYMTSANKLKWQNEFYLQNRPRSFLVTDSRGRTKLNANPWGLYSLVDYRLSPRLGVGGRFDYVEPVDVDPSTRARAADVAWAGYLTFYQSEFSRWRLQYKHTDFAAGGDDNTVFVQGTVAIGVHKHQLQ